ncbi:hypothetical protein VTH82DRAFT_7076 [Thermothelomyces myriococcoides]
MASLRSLFAAGLLFLSAANAHFELNEPAPLEGDNMDESLQNSGPCGGGRPDLSKNTATDFHVDGDTVSWLLTHPQANFLIRGTLDEKAEGNWTQLFPIVQQSGRGDLCEPSVTAPREWAGKKGFIGIACAAPDGMLFQCAAVNFVSGAADQPPSSCTNGTSVSASFTDDESLTALLDDSSADGPSSTSDSPSPSDTGNAAPTVRVGSGSLPIGALASTVAMLLLGTALL